MNENKSFSIKISDIKFIEMIDGIVTGIKMKRKGTYNGKRYERAPVLHSITTETPAIEQDIKTIE